MTLSAAPTWNSIVQRALLGTERATPAVADTPSELQSMIARVDPRDAERALLASAAIVAAYESAGRLPVRATSTSTNAAPLESDDQPAAPPRVARFLTTMLGGVNSEVLREWFRLVAARGWRVPTTMIPALLEIGTSAGYLRTFMLPVLGARGRWLATQNNDWRWAAGHPEMDDAALRAGWEIGTPDERASILATARARDAALGRALVESTWEEEAPTQRAALLAHFGTNLSLDDEPFLERALDDRRQEVRRYAASLLCHLPTSALATRMAERAKAALQWKPRHLMKGPELVVDPPTELDDATLRDGLAKKPPQGMGERAWWLAQIVATVPPRVWSETWQATPHAIIAAAFKGDWRKELTAGWAAAAVLHRDAAWAEAILASGFSLEKPTPIAPTLHSLLSVLSVEQRETFVTRALRDAPTAEQVVTLVAAADHAWSDHFARTVLDWLRKRVRERSTAGPYEWHLREIIPRLAMQVPPALAGATDGWPASEDAGAFAKALDQFISVLTFRRELAEELDR